MLVLVCCAQLAAAQPTYSSPALREMIAAAAEANRRVPDVLAGYRVPVQSELSMVSIDTLGRESRWHVEEVAAVSTWSRRGGEETRVVGRRSVSPLSMITEDWFGLDQGWLVPSLYGERVAIWVPSAG